VQLIVSSVAVKLAAAGFSLDRRAAVNGRKHSGNLRIMDRFHDRSRAGHGVEFVEVQFAGVVVQIGRVALPLSEGDHSRQP
jgi:hypothetical protein